MRQHSSSQLMLSQRWQMLCAIIVSSLSIPIVWTGCNVAYQFASGMLSPLIMVYLVHDILPIFAFAFSMPFPLCLSIAFVALTIFRFSMSSHDKPIVLRPVYFVATSGLFAAVASLLFTVLIQVRVGFGNLDFSTELFMVFRDSVSISIASAVLYFIIFCSSLKYALHVNPQHVGITPEALTSLGADVGQD